MPAWRHVFYLVGAALLGACQIGGPPTLTLEEAKQVTAKFEDEDFTPPPRSINDIVNSVYISRDTDGNVDPSCFNVSEGVGLSEQEIRDRMAHLPSFDPYIWPNKSALPENQAELQFSAGNFSRAAKYLQWAINTIPDKYHGALAQRNAKLAVYHAFAGNFDSADQAISAADTNYNRTNRSRWLKRWIARVSFDLRRGLGAIAKSRGELTDAEMLYRRAIKDLQNGGGGGDYDSRNLQAMTELAGVLMDQGRLVEAEVTVRQAIKLSGRSTPYHRQAAVISRLGEIIFEQGRFSDAEILTRLAIDLYGMGCASPDSLAVAVTRSILGKTLVAQGRWRDALGQYDTIRNDMRSDRHVFRSKFSDNVDWALALMFTGKPQDAALMLREALARNKERLGEIHYKTAVTGAFLALTESMMGNREHALSELANVVPVMLSRYRESDDESSTFVTRDSQLRIVLDSYIGLLAEDSVTPEKDKKRFDGPAEAFRLAGIVHGRSVQRALSASSTRAIITDPELADLVRREQDSQKQVAALYGVLANMLSGSVVDSSASTEKDLRARIENLRSARGALTAEIEKYFPDYAQLINPKPIAIDTARSLLHPDEALIVTYVGDNRTFVWAVPWRGKASFATLDMSREELSDQVAMLRSAMEPNTNTLGDIPAFDVGAAYELYEKLLKPVEAGWKDAKSLLVVTDGPFGQLPLSLLPTEPVTLGPEKAPLFANYRTVPWLARTHAVTVLPSVASLKALRSTAAASGERRPFAGFGDPYFAKHQQLAAAKAKPVQVASADAAARGISIKLRSTPLTRAVDSAEIGRLPRLPDTRREINAIAEAMGANSSRDLFLGVKANEDQVKTMDLSLYRVIAFATHGLVPGDLNGLTQPALALSAPEVVGDKEDGLLTMGEILGLKLNADWVVLSACNTAAADGKGAEAVSGLGRAFFYAGTRALLVSNWPVHSAATTELTTTLFMKQAANDDLSRTEALRQTRLHLIDEAGFNDDRGRMVFSYAHPIFWAPFTVVGDGDSPKMPGP